MPLSHSDIQKYKKLFLQSANNYAENMQENIAFLINRQHVFTAIKQVHLDAHSLKSQSTLMGYGQMAKLAEIIEFLFNKEEKEGEHIKHSVLIKIQADVARLIDSLKEIEKNDREMDLTDRIEELEKFRSEY